MLGEWQVWKEALPKSICDDYLHRLKQLPVSDGNIGEEGTNYNIRRSKVSFLPGRIGYEDVYDMIDNYVSRINRDYFGFDISYGVRDIQFTKYSGQDKGHYNWHHDVFYSQKEPYHRKLSFTLQLSDPGEYTGGDFEFRDVENVASDLLRPQGSILVFPSFLYHRVTPVQEGTRYSLVSWIDGPRWR